MKKKITAILLTLCMVIGLLPLSALAAAWKVTLNGQEITLNVDDTTGAVTSEPDQSQYYTFTKLEGQDKFEYYTTGNVYCGQLAGTPVTLELECTCTTKCESGKPNSECPVCSAEGADLEKDCLGAVVTVEGSTTTVEVAADASGKVEAVVELTDENVSGMVNASDDGSVTVAVKTPEDSGTDVKEMAVTLPKNLLAAAKQSSKVSSLVVDTEVAAVTLPLAVLTVTDNVTLTMTKVESIAGVLGGVSLNLSAGGTFAAPVAVSIKVETQVESPVVAYSSGGKLFRVRQNPVHNGEFCFFTRHFSDFVVVDAGAAALEANNMENTGSGRDHVYAIEADEALIAAVKASDGSLNYMAVGPVADKMLDSTVNARVNAPDSEIDNIAAVAGEVTLNSDGTPVTADAIRVDPAFSDLL